MTCKKTSENIPKILSFPRQHRRFWIVLLIILGAWGWYRGTLYWRVTSERDRLIALQAIVTNEDWANWGKARDDLGPIGHAWRWVVGEADLQRLDEISQRLNVVEGGQKN